MACALTLCQEYGCDTPITAPGLLGEEIILVNFTQIDKDASTFNVAGEMTQLVLTAGSDAFLWQGGPDSVTINNTGTFGTNVSGKFTHQVAFMGIGNTWLKKSQAYDAIVKGRIVAFVRDKDSNIHVFGYGAGLRSELAWNAMDNDGLWAITAATREPEFENNSALNFVGTGTPAPTLAAAWAQLVALTNC